MRSFDSLDSTPLFLMTAARYLGVSGNSSLFTEIGQNIRQALVWILEYADINHDGLIDYRMHPDRKHGGLYVQNWMDHETSLYHEDGTPVAMPIAPVEVQAYAYASLRAWAEIYKSVEPDFAGELKKRALELKRLFNERYPVKSTDGLFLASGIDGADKQILSVRSSMGHVLWAALKMPDGRPDGILEDRFLAPVVNRLLQPDLFELHAGIRTVSTRSVGYAPDGYHHGAIWPHDTSIVAEGLENFGFIQEARTIREALFEAYAHFKTPLELFVYDGEYKEFRPSYRDPACKKQAWSAAAMVADAAALLAV
jgi:glycogen debranching enzyme